MILETNGLAKILRMDNLNGLHEVSDKEVIVGDSNVYFSETICNGMVFSIVDIDGVKYKFIVEENNKTHLVVKGCDKRTYATFGNKKLIITQTFNIECINIESF